MEATSARIDKGVKLATILRQYNLENFPNVSAKDAVGGDPGGEAGGSSSSWGAAPIARPTVFRSWSESLPEY